MFNEVHEKLNKTEFGIDLGSGYRINNLDFGLHSNTVDNLNYLNLCVAYGFDI